MTKIVKAVAVVEDRIKAPPPIEIEPPSTVLKRGMLEQGFPKPPQLIPSKDTLTGELNRLRVEIKQSQSELKTLAGQLETVRKRAGEEEQALRELAARQAEKQLEVPAEEISEDLITQAEQTAEQIISQAKARAKTILDQAETEGAALAEQAKNDGYLEGFSKGHEESAAEFRRENEPKAAQIADILDNLSTYWEDTLRESQSDLVELVMAVAAKVLGRALEDDPGAIVEMLRGIVEENKREEYVKITLSPELAQVTAYAGRDVRTLLENLGANVNVLTTAGIDDGTLTVETTKGIVDVSIQTQLDNISSAIHER